MFRSSPEILETADRRFVVWLWNYSYTTEWKDEDKLRSAGYDLVICPASSSSGDSPFLPQWEKHAANIAGAAAVARSDHALGICITSWSIRMGLKIAQLPLWELGAGIFLHRQELREAEASVRGKYFGGFDPEISGEWDWYLMLLSGVQWTKYKDAQPPPAGHFAGRLKSEPDAYRALPEKLSRMIEQSGSALSRIPQQAPSSAVAAACVQGAELRLRYLQLILKLLRREEIPLQRLQTEKEAFEKYLAQEQTPASAAHNAGLIYDPLIEYAESVMRSR